MPTKQELMGMMDNHLPGVPLTVRDYANQSQQPPAYPITQGTLYGDQQNKQYEQQRPGPAHIYSITQPAINYTPIQFGARSHLAYCPSCRVTETTRCEYQNSMMTHIIAAVLLCTTCCCCLPYFFNSCKNARHFCSNCGTYLGAQTK